MSESQRKPTRSAPGDGEDGQHAIRMEPKRGQGKIDARTAYYTWRPVYGTAIYMPPGVVVLETRLGFGLPGLPEGGSFRVKRREDLRCRAIGRKRGGIESMVGRGCGG